MSPSQPTAAAVSARAKTAVIVQAVSAGVAVASHRFSGREPQPQRDVTERILHPLGSQADTRYRPVFWGSSSSWTSMTTDSGGARLGGRIVTEDSLGDVAIRNAMRVKQEAGVFDVIGHGTPSSISGMSARTC